MVKLQIVDVTEYDNRLKYGSEYIILLFCIDDNGNSYCLNIKNFKPYFYIEYDRKKYRVEDFEEMRIGKWEQPLHKLTQNISVHKFKKLDEFQLNKNTYLKLEFKSLGNYNRVKKHFNDKVEINDRRVQIQRYESNIVQFLRFFHKQNINVSSWINVDKKKLKNIDTNSRISICKYEYEVSYENILPYDANKIGPLKILSFDIECTSEDGSFPQFTRKNDKIIQIGTTVETFGKGKEYDYNYIISLKKCNDIENTTVVNCKNELELIQKWCEEVRRIDPDVIIGYNIWGFDYQYIFERAKLLTGEDEIELEKHLNISRLKTGTGNGYIKYDAPYSQNEKLYHIKQLSSSAMGDNILKYLNIMGRVNIDLLKYVRDNKKLSMYKLDYVAEKFIGQKKNDVTPNDIFNWYHEGKPEKVTEIAKYCIQDCKLVNKLLTKLSVIENCIGMANTCWVPLNYIFLRGQGIKAHSLVLKECSELGYIVPQKNKIFNDDDKEKFKGATVLTAKSGIHYYPVSALDFASLYPSSMISHNLCISSFIDEDRLNKYIKKYNWKVDKYRKVEWEEDGIIKKYFYVQPDKNNDNYIEDKDRAVIPQILLKLLNKRNETKKLMKKEKDPFKKSILDGLQLAYKVTANSMYGQLGSNVGPIGKKEVAASITTTGRQLLELAQDFILKHYSGSTAIYGDSVTKDTPILLKNKKTNNIEIKQIDDLFDIDNNKRNYHELKPFDTIQSNRREKEQNTSLDYEIWTSEGWCNIKRVIRHKCNKKIYRINTHTSCVDVTEDHSLLNNNKEKVKTNDVDLKTELLQNYPLFENKKVHLDNILEIIENDIEEIELQKHFLYGFFFGDGSCGKYNTQYGIKYSWALNNQDKKLLEKLQLYLKNTCDIESKILETMKSSNVYKLVPIGNIKDITMKFRELFYNKDKYKIIPTNILNTNYSNKLYFFAGYYAADGGKCKNEPSKSIRFSNKGKIGTSQFYYLLQSIGLNCSISCREDKLDIYRITVSSNKFRKKENQIKKILDLSNTNDYVYDIEIEEKHHNFQAGIGNLIVSNTDSVFIKFNLKRHNENCPFHKNNMIERKKKYHLIKKNICDEMKLSNEEFLHSREAKAVMIKTDFLLYKECECDDIPDLMSEEALKESIRLACEVDAIITDLLPDKKIFKDGKQIDGCQQLEYEKTYMPYILFTKKRYVGKLFEYKTDLEKDWYLDYKGIVLKRRDNADIVKKFYKNCLMKIMEGSKKNALKYLEDSLYELMDNDKNKKYPIEDFILSKTLSSIQKYKQDKKFLQIIMLLNKFLLIKKEVNKSKISKENINLIIDNYPTTKYTIKKCFETCNHTSYCMITGIKKLTYKMTCEKCNPKYNMQYGINQFLDYLNDTYNSTSVKKEDRDIVKLTELKTYRFDKKNKIHMSFINGIEILANYYNNKNDINLKRMKIIFNKIQEKDIYNELTFSELRKINKTQVILANRMKERDPGSAPQINERVQYCFVEVKGDEKKYLQGDLVETPDYIKKNNIPINYNYYIKKQLENPLLQLFLYVDQDKSKQIFNKILILNKSKNNGQKSILDFMRKNKI